MMMTMMVPLLLLLLLRSSSHVTWQVSVSLAIATSHLVLPCAPAPFVTPSTTHISPADRKERDNTHLKDKDGAKTKTWHLRSSLTAYLPTYLLSDEQTVPVHCTHPHADEPLFLPILPSSARQVLTLGANFSLLWAPMSCVFSLQVHLHLFHLHMCLDACPTGTRRALITELSSPSPLVASCSVVRM